MSFFRGVEVKVEIEIEIEVEVEVFLVVPLCYVSRCYALLRFLLFRLEPIIVSRFM